MNEWILAASSAGLASVITGLVTARRAASRARADSDQAREQERSAARRRIESAERALVVAEQHARRLAGLDPLLVPTMQGGLLARAVAKRLSGLSIDCVVLADDAGLAWVGTPDATSDAVAASAGAYLVALSNEAVGLDVELADTRHVALRVLPGASPRLALGAVGTSQPPAPHAIVAAVELARVATGAVDEPVVRARDRRPYRIGADSPSQVTAALCDELERARGERELLAIFAGVDLLAASAESSLSPPSFTSLTGKVIDVVSYLERRMGSTARCAAAHLSDGRTLSIAPLGQGRFRVAALDDVGGLDGLLVERLVGRVRRLLPAPVASDVLFQRVA